MEILLQLLVYLLFVIIFFSGIRKEGTLSGDECYKRLNTMRGIWALEIIIGHVVRHEDSILFPLGKFMLVGVAFFFFMSGWGLCKSFHEKGNYLDDFLKTRVVYICWLIISALIITSIIDFICPIDTQFSIHSSDGIEIIRKLINNINWYMRELLLLYLLFYWNYKFIKKHRILILTIIVISIACVFGFLGFERPWYASIMAFPLGFVFYSYFPKMIDFIRKPKGIMLVGGLGILGLSSLVIDESMFIPIFVANNSLCICVIMILVIFFTIFHVENGAKRFLNKYATELYLFQFIFLAIAKSAGWNYWYKMLFVVALDILLSVLVRPVVSGLKGVCKK